MSLIADYLQGIRLMKRLEGWHAAVRYTLLPFVDFHRAVVMCRSLLSPIPEPKHDPETTIRFATQEDLHLFIEMIPSLRLKRFAKKMQAGEICIMAMRDGKVVGLGWASFIDTPTARTIPVRLGPKEAYLWGGYVLPVYRSHGIVTAMGFAMLRYLKEQGYESSYQITDLHNTPALKQGYRSGNVPVAHITSFRLLEWRWVRRRPIEQPLPATLKANSDTTGQ